MSVFLSCSNLKSDHKFMSQVGTYEIISVAQKNAKAKATGKTDFFLRISSQDYFIKFCESILTQTEFEQHFFKSHSSGSMKFRLKYSIKEGLWDQCSDELQVSRTGKYVCIDQILP